MSSQKDSDRKWVVVQLTQSGEREKNLASLEKNVFRSLKAELTVFIPAASQKAREDTQVVFFMDGYIFVEYRMGINYHRLNNSHYFEFVLADRRNSYRLLNDSEIEPLRRGVENLKAGKLQIGDSVKVLKGTFKNLTGTVSFVYESGENVQINLKLSSKPVLIDYPSSYLLKI